jgi:hypothetical protein
MSESCKKEVSYFHRFRQWFRNHITQEVPDDYQSCEFDCRELQCSMGDWEKCERRLRSLAQNQEIS